MEILTLTHARIRASQGDVAGARRVLREILLQSPDDLGARALLEELAGQVGVEPSAESEEVLPVPESADPRALADHFRRSLGPTHKKKHDVSGRVRRLETWLKRIRGRHPDRP